MRGKSHIRLGEYLIANYMEDSKKLHQKIFLLGCIQPDKNPFTYLKGSLRCQPFHGHNYCNSIKFMARISRRLENRRNLKLLDYYTLGKLIHYTADAFTYAHNETFPGKLSSHRIYETQLQFCFLKYLHGCTKPNPPASFPIMDIIRRHHREYSRQRHSTLTDCIYIVKVNCDIIALLFASSK